MPKPLILCSLVILTAAHALAGVEFVAQTRSDGGGDVTVHAFVSGSRAKVVFVESALDLYATGDYMLSPDEGNFFFFFRAST